MIRKFAPAVAATALCAAALAAPSLAQDPGSSDAPTTEQQESVKERPTDEEREARKAEAKERFDGYFADELGVTVEQLQAARESAKASVKADMREELVVRLDEKVAAGEITQERADEILERFDSNEGMPRRGPGHRGDRGQNGPRGERGGTPAADGTSA